MQPMQVELGQAGPSKHQLDGHQGNRNISGEVELASFLIFLRLSQA